MVGSTPTTMSSSGKTPKTRIGPKNQKPPEAGQLDRAPGDEGAEGDDQAEQPGVALGVASRSPGSARRRGRDRGRGGARRASVLLPPWARSSLSNSTVDVLPIDKLAHFVNQRNKSVSDCVNRRSGSGRYTPPARVHRSWQSSRSIISGVADLPDPAALGERRGALRRLRRSAAAASRRRRLDGRAQPRPGDGLLRRPLRRQHPGAAEDLAALRGPGRDRRRGPVARCRLAAVEDLDRLLAQLGVEQREVLVGELAGGVVEFGVADLAVLGFLEGLELLVGAGGDRAPAARRPEGDDRAPAARSGRRSRSS